MRNLLTAADSSGSTRSHDHQHVVHGLDRVHKGPRPPLERLGRGVVLRVAKQVEPDHHLARGLLAPALAHEKGPSGVAHVQEVALPRVVLYQAEPARARGSSVSRPALAALRFGICDPKILRLIETLNKGAA